MHAIVASEYAFSVHAGIRRNHAAPPTNDKFTDATTHHAPRHTTPNPFRIPRQTRLAGGGYGNSATKQYATQRCQLPISRNTLSSVLGYQPNICVPSSASEM